MGWCFKPMPALELAQHCKTFGMPAIEGINPKLYPQNRQLGLDISLVSSHGFKPGMVNRSEQQKCIQILKERAAILQAVRSFFIDQSFLEVETPLRIPATAPEEDCQGSPFRKIPCPFIAEYKVCVTGS